MSFAMYLSEIKQQERINKRKSEEFQQGVFATMGNVYRWTIGHNKVTAFAPNIFGYFIQINNIGVVYAKEIIKIM